MQKIFKLVLLALPMGFFFPLTAKTATPDFSVRGWVLLLDDMDYLRQTIQKAPEFGINHLELSHAIVHHVDELFDDPDRLAHVRELIDLGHQSGAKVYIWTHELNGVPRSFWRRGKLEVDSNRFWKWLRNKYQRVFELLPDVDGLILTTVETEVVIYDDVRVRSSLPPAERLLKLYSELYNVCKSRKKELWVRTFNSQPEGYFWTQQALKRAPKGIRVLTKHVFFDWWEYYPLNPLLGDVGDHVQVAEFDLCGQFHGHAYYPWLLGDYLGQRIRQLVERHVDGAVARIAWHGQHSFGTPNEGNIWAFSRWLNEPNLSAKQAYRDWAQKRYGKQAGEKVLNILLRTNDLVQKILFVHGFKSVESGNVSGLKHLLVVRKLHPLVTRDFISRYKPGLRPVAEELVHPKPTTRIWVRREKEEASRIARRCLQDVEVLRPELKPSRYRELRDGFARTVLAARVWKPLAELSVAYGIWEQSGNENDAEVLRCLAYQIEAVADEVGKSTYATPLTPAHKLYTLATDLRRILRPEVQWAYWYYGDFASAPVLADLNGDGKKEILVVNRGKSLHVLDCRGRRRWLFQTKGLGWAYPSMTSRPLTVDLDGDGQKEVLFGAADGRLLALGKQGELRWWVQTGGAVSAGPVLIPGQPPLVVFGSHDGLLRAVDRWGNVRWKADLREPIQQTPLVCPAPSGGGMQIVAWTENGRVLAVGEAGKPLWGSGLGEPTTGAAYLALPQQPQIVFTTRSGRVFGLSLAGRKLWSCELGAVVTAPPAVWGKSNTAEVLVGTADGELLAVAPGGTVRRVFQNSAALTSPPVAADVDGDGRAEFVCGEASGAVAVLSQDGEVLWRFSGGSDRSAVVAPPLVTDLDGDGRTEILVPGTDHFLLCLRPEL